MSDQAPENTDPVAEVTAATDPAPTPAKAAKPKAEKAKAEKPKASEGEDDGVVVYRTREQEALNIRFMGLRPIRNPEYPMHYEWRVPAKDEVKADTHYHVRTGRIVKVG